jgi:glycerol-3-phosphate acyltransferase PlsY
MPRISLVTLNNGMTLWLLILAASYLLGSIPVGYLLVLTFRKEDVRETGSGNIGATNVARAGGKGLGIATLLLDALKGYLAVLLAMHFAPTAGGVVSTLAIAAAVAAVVGHIFTVWLGFKGGKGIATALGVFIALVPLVAFGAFVIFLLVFAISRFVSLASIAAAAAIPLLALWLVPQHTPALLLGLSAISLLSIIKHHANISRLLKGTESKFSSKKKVAA